MQSLAEMAITPAGEFASFASKLNAQEQSSRVMHRSKFHVIAVKAGTQAAWVPAFAGMTKLANGLG